MTQVDQGDEVALDHQERLDAEARARPDDEVGHAAGLDRADVGIDAGGDGRVDGELRHVALDALVVGARRGFLGQAPDPLLHHRRELPALGDVLGETAHALRVGGEDGDRAHVVQEVLGGHCLAVARAPRRKRRPRDAEVEEVREHRHRHALSRPYGV